MQENLKALQSTINYKTVLTNILNFRDRTLLNLGAAQENTVTTLWYVA